MVAAAVAALVYATGRERLSRFARRLVYGERPPPDEVLRVFAGRMTRSLPLDELLLQLAELLRRTLALAAAEVWAGSGPLLERAASDPERGPATITLAEAERPVLARAGVAGPGWLRVWLPQLLEGRQESEMRVAPITHSGELFGLIVVERGPGGVFDDEDERVLADLARQVGLALRNVRLDSELQASLEQLRRQAEELRASRARVVAAADAERRRIERDLHDGAQQHLTALAINIRLIRELAGTSADEARAGLDQLGRDVQDALDELRDPGARHLPAAARRPRARRGSHRRDAPRSRTRPARARRRLLATRRRGRDNRVPATSRHSRTPGKHAGPGATALVRVGEDEGGLLFEVEDDGGGFDPARSVRGAGLTSMADRLGAIGGSLQIESDPGRGTRIVGAIPLST